MIWSMLNPSNANFSISPITKTQMSHVKSFWEQRCIFYFICKNFVNNFERDQKSGIENLFDSTQALPLGLFG